GDVYKRQYQGEKSDVLKANQVKINNLKNKKDVITVSKIKKKDVIKVYSTNGKLLATSKPANSSSIKLYVKQVGAKSGKAVSYTHLRDNETLYMIWYSVYCLKKSGGGGGGGGGG
ncbi:hypothetical protein ACQ4LK_24690, partial [Bacillus pumilus]